VHLVAPVIKRDKAGEVNITTEAPVGSIRYTTDGTQPTASSPAFIKPFLLADGGEIKAISLDGSNKPSEISAQIFGLAKSNWNIMGDDGKKAIDDDANTFAAKTNLSEFVVDMGSERAIKAFTYLPRQDKQTDGLISGYSWAISNDSTNWQTIAEGEFSNIKSNPVEQLVPLKTAIKARYFKLTAIKLISGTGISAAEIGAQVK
jgi:alpha-L-fucosidase